MFCTGHAFLADGRLFVAGGHIQNGVGLPRASLYNPFSNTWAAAPDMNAGRWYPTVTTLANGDALVVSGSIDTTVGGNTLPQVYQAAIEHVAEPHERTARARPVPDDVPGAEREGLPCRPDPDHALSRHLRHRRVVRCGRIGRSGATATMDPPSCMRTARSWWSAAGIHRPTPRRSSTSTSSRRRPGAQWRP